MVVGIILSLHASACDGWPVTAITPNGTVRSLRFERGRTASRLFDDDERTVKSSDGLTIRRW